MDIYEIFAGALILMVSVALPALVALRAAYRQHSRWLIIAYAAATSAFGTYVQGLAPQSHDPQSFNIGDGVTFLVGLVLFGVLGGGVYLLLRKLGAAKPQRPTPRAQAAHLAVFIGLLGLGIALVFLLDYSPF